MDKKKSDDIKFDSLSLYLQGKREQGIAMQRGLGGFPHERLHQDGNREREAGVVGFKVW
ncbi:MAG: hypothetical protein F6K50_19150 [Moorea sp. SIO3I7]|uniref:hypothetical protein n=1 Tax=Moorena sp. SIO3I8 TaxID=2607833 RepID=UPI0013BF782B|nr:hypothetical protein [Moorena sp. SIO3I8]NEN97562.1 hypothetical protein [Moorena sp. SIO3I7]NEO04870.1 hypothetical protein [Moorena sp. SIO3I8]